MNLLNIPRFVDGERCPAANFNAIVDATNQLIEFKNAYDTAQAAKKDISTAIVVGLAATYDYTGEAVVPTGYRVYLGNKLLVAGVDYDSECQNNIEIGNATLKLVGITDQVVGTKNVTFAIEGKKYNLTYNAQGHGTAPASKKISVLTANDLPTLTAANYDFKGWFKAAEGGTAVTAGTILTEDTTLYAHWEASTFAITLSSAHGNVTPLTGLYSTIPTLPTPTEAGYWFIGWYYDAAYTQKANAGDTLTKAVTLYAKWIDNEYEMEMNLSTNKLAITKDETDAAAVLKVSIDGGAYAAYTAPINLDATKTIKAKIEYGTQSTSEPNIKGEYDADNDTLKFTTSKSGATITITGIASTSGVISDVSEQTPCTFTVSDGEQTCSCAIVSTTTTTTTSN